MDRRAAALGRDHDRLHHACGHQRRNGILKISHYINLVLREGETFGRAMIVRGSLERLTPVLMTALSAGFALVPLMIGADAPGKEILHPVAIVIFGGLVSLDAAGYDPHPRPVPEIRRQAIGKAQRRSGRVQPERGLLMPTMTQPRRMRMLRALAVILSLVLAVPALAHTDSKWTKGPQGGHIVDAGGGKQHWELVAKGSELVLYVTDADEKPVKADGGSAKGEVLVGGKTYKVDFKPAGANTLKATGEFTAAKGMKVIVKTDKVGGQSFQARLAPLN